MKNVYSFDSAFDASAGRERWRTIGDIEAMAHAEDIENEQAQTYRDVLIENLEDDEELLQEEREKNHRIESGLAW